MTSGGPASAPDALDRVRLTHIGGPTVLVELGGWRILSDPTFDPAGRIYRFGWGTSSKKLTDPSRSLADIGSVDAVLVSHDQHADNLDDAGRSLLPSVGSVVTTKTAAGRLTGPVHGLDPWETTTLEAPGRPTITVTATPCRHGPPLSRPIVGPVVGFALAWEGQANGVLWLSGDTVLYDGVKEVADRLSVSVAVLHLGVVQFPITGPLKYTMSAQDAIELTGLIRPQIAVPVHYEGWSHFHQGRAQIEQAVEAAPTDVRDRFRLVDLGVPADLPV